MFSSPTTDSLRAEIEECRLSLGPAPRQFGYRERQNFFPSVPQWLQHDPLKPIIQDRKILLREGRLVLSTRIQANANLYGPGPQDYPALIIWSADPKFETEPQILRELAHQISSLKGKNFDDERKVVADLITNEMARPQNMPLPKLLAGESEIFLSALMIFRRHLPFGFLSGDYYPLLVCPEKTRASMILPAKFWPEAWKDR